MKNKGIRNSLAIAITVTIFGSCGSSKGSTATTTATRKADLQAGKQGSAASAMVYGRGDSRYFGTH